MMSSISVKYLNWLNNKVLMQKILLFNNNSPSYMLVTLSNVAIKFLPRETILRLQPLDQGIIAFLERVYMKCMMSNITTAMKTSKILLIQQIR